MLGLGILILGERQFMKNLSFTTIIQGPLVVVVTGIVLKLYFDGKEGWELVGDQLVSIPVTEGLSGFIGQFTTPDFSAFLNPAIYTIGITMAVVASLETLLCVEATDKLDPYKRVTPTNRELLAQGAGNIVSGLVGGLPITQVIVRSSANIQSGGRTKASAFLHGALLLISAFAIPAVLNLIPLAALAAVLLIVGYKLAKPSMIIGMWKKGSNEFIPFAVTVLGIVLTDLLMGIALGLVVAIVSILWDNFKVPYKFDIRNSTQVSPGVAIVARDTWAAMRARKALEVQWDTQPASADDSGDPGTALTCTSIAPPAIVATVEITAFSGMPKVESYASTRLFGDPPAMLKSSTT